MRYLLCNDDGIDAPGIKHLSQAAKALSDDVWSIAPAGEQSAKGRAITLRTAIKVDQRGEKEFAVHGTPADCAVYALNRSPIIDQRPDLFLSGVNAGANMAEDVAYSGTLGCAFEAAQHGIPAIGFSQLYPIAQRDCIDWDVTEAWLPRLIDYFSSRHNSCECVLNINFPEGPVSDVKGVTFARQGNRGLAVNLIDMEKGGHFDAFRFGHIRTDTEAAADSDVALARGGWITVTPLWLSYDASLETGMTGEISV